MNQSFLYSCDVTSFSSETQNIRNQGKKRGLFISGHGLSAQPYLKHPWLVDERASRQNELAPTKMPTSVAKIRLRWFLG